MMDRVGIEPGSFEVERGEAKRTKEFLAMKVAYSNKSLIMFFLVYTMH